MTGHEDEAEDIVPNVLVQSLDPGCSLPRPLNFASDLGLLSLEHLAAADQIDGAMLRGPHQPGPGLFRDARCRPLLECRNKCVLCEFLSRFKVADDASQPRDKPG